MTDYDKFRKKNNNDKKVISLSELTDKQKAMLKVEHYNLHIPAGASPKQISFIQNVAKAVLDNKPIAIVYEVAMQKLLRWAYSYRNILTEFDEQDRWSEEDDIALNKISLEFKPILDYLKEQYKLNIAPFRRD